jgi:pimeloyl-ACP methyl ester carboxylesterase
VTIVHLHAFPLDERMWEDAWVTPHLYDLGSTMEDWAEAVLASVEGLVILVGASMGGYCALAAARMAPERIAGLVLVGSRADADSPERRDGRADTIRMIETEGAAGLWESMRPKLFSDDADRRTVEQARVIALEQDPAELVRAVAAIRDRADSTQVLRALGDRAVVVLGDRDPFVSADEVEGEVRVLAACGHLASLERPREFAAILEEAVARWM